MKSNTVIWWPPAQDDLTLVWIDSDDRQAIADAANEIERVLGLATADVGSAVHEGMRQLIVRPLLVQFVVDEGDRKVTILSVKKVI